MYEILCFLLCQDHYEITWVLGLGRFLACINLRGFLLDLLRNNKNNDKRLDAVCQMLPPECIRILSQELGTSYL